MQLCIVIVVGEQLQEHALRLVAIQLIHCLTQLVLRVPSRSASWPSKNRMYPLTHGKARETKPLVIVPVITDDEASGLAVEEAVVRPFFAGWDGDFLLCFILERLEQLVYVLPRVVSCEVRSLTFLVFELGPGVHARVAIFVAPKAPGSGLSKRGQAQGDEKGGVGKHIEG